MESLQLAKISTLIVDAVVQLMRKWTTCAHLHGETERIQTDCIACKRGLLQGNTINLILLVLSANPLSFLFKKHDGHKVGSRKDQNISHLFFVDDLKLYAQSITKPRMMLETVYMFSKDIGMKIRELRCAYHGIERGKQKAQDAPLIVISLKIKEIEEQDQYKYLGMDELVGMLGPLNKDRVIKEYKSKCD